MAGLNHACWPTAVFAWPITHPRCSLYSAPVTHFFDSRTTDALASSRYIRHHSATVELVLPRAGNYSIFAMAVEHGEPGRGDYNGGGVRILVTVECTDLGSSLKKIG